jgi:fatty-acyl-CoA synthase
MQDWIAPDPVALHAQGRSERLALVDLATGRRWTYAALDRAIERAVSALAEFGVEPGDRVAALAKNSADLLILQQGTMRLGAIFVPLNWRLAPAEIGPILADCTPKLLVGDGTVVVELPEGCRALGLVAFGEAVAAAVPGPRRPMRSAEAPCVILYTSGTSGQPKG